MKRCEKFMASSKLDWKSAMQGNDELSIQLTHFCWKNVSFRVPEERKQIWIQQIMSLSKIKLRRLKDTKIIWLRLSRKEFVIQMEFSDVISRKKEKIR